VVPTIEESIHIPASPMMVSEILLDAEAAPRWTSGLERLEVIEGAAGEPGSVGHAHYVEGRRRYVVEDRLIESVPGSHFTSRITGGGLRADIHTTLDETPSGTRVTIRWQGSGTNPLTTLVLLLMKRRIVRRMRQDMEALRVVVVEHGAKVGLTGSLEQLNTAVLAKLDGLGEYDLRRPLTATGSNLLGIVKHLATVQAGYLGACFGRPWSEPMPWMGPEAVVNADMFAAPDESSDWIRDLYRRSWDHARSTVAATDLDATGTVPWWPPERRHPTLRAVMTHLLVETARHAGHLDILRELIDGSIGRHPGDGSIPSDGEIDWPAYVGQVEAAAKAAAAASTPDQGPDNPAQ
jgi:uncharacterized damage-inducible protein DinB